MSNPTTRYPSASNPSDQPPKPQKMSIANGFTARRAPSPPRLPMSQRLSGYSPQSFFLSTASNARAKVQLRVDGQKFCIDGCYRIIHGAFPFIVIRNGHHDSPENAG